MTTIQMNELRLPIDGLAGEACARRIEHALKAVAGVSSTVVNPVNGFASIVYDPARVGLALFERAVHAVGCGTALPDRAVLRLRAKSDGTAHDNVPVPPHGKSSRATPSITDEGIEPGILQHLIDSALERTEVSAAPSSECCPKHADTMRRTDHIT